MTLLAMLIFSRMPVYWLVNFWTDSQRTPMHASIITPERRAKMQAAAQADNRNQRRTAMLSDLRRSDRAEPVDPEDEHDVGDASIQPTRDAVLT
jgi:hypothetical protein